MAFLLKRVRRRAIDSTCRLFVGIFCRRATILFVTGLRRSGNHAVIEWIKSGFDSADPIDYRVCGYKNVGVSANRRVVHFNDVTRLRFVPLVSALVSSLWQEAGSARLVVFSEEDRSPHSRRWWAREARIKIYLTRDFLNNVASRLQPMVKSAAQGKVDRRFELYDQLPDHWLALRNAPEEEGRIRLHYDRWLADSAYRRSLAILLGMARDGIPGYHSTKGGGSSFVGSSASRALANSGAYLERFRDISWSNEMIETIRTWDERWGVLSGTERSYIQGVSCENAMSGSLRGGSYRPHVDKK